MATRSAYVPIRGSEREPLPGARVVGAADPAQEIKVTVLVRRRQDSRLSDVVDELSSQPPHQRRYLSREELATAHGSDPAELARVADFARAQGLTVLETNPLTRSVVLAGRVSAFSSAFQVELARYRQGQASYRGRRGPVQIPAELSGVIEGVLGLDDRRQAEPRPALLVSPGGRGAAPAALAPFTPVQVAQLYDFPTTVTGQGQTIGIIELGGGFTAADLQTFFTQLNLQQPAVTVVSVDGGQNNPSPGAPTNEDMEVALDIEVAGAVAPGAAMAVYFAPNTDQGFLDAITTAVHDAANNPSVISISWGNAEVNWTGQTMQAFEQAFQDASALGVTVCIASGDNGSSDGVNDNLAHVDFPASAVHALGCGGTELEAAGATIANEVVWNDASGATGGGISDQFDLSSWQSNIGVPASVNPGQRIGRGVPDVSGDADPATGYEIVVGGQRNPVGGTSAVAPLWSGLLALLNQGLGKRIGFLNPLIYAELGGPALRDITTGNNGAYAAGPGWDACTGLGSPDGIELLAALRSELQLCGITDIGGMWHTIRHADGTWQPQFGDVTGQSGNPGHFAAVSCAGVRDELQLCGITDDGGMWHTIRHSDGTWQPQFGDVKGQSGNPGFFSATGCADVSGELQVCGITDDGGMWHTIRHSDGTWQPQFGDVKGQSGNPGHFIAVACGGVQGELQVCGLTDDGGMWHTIRHADGTWQPQFGDVKGQSGNPGHFIAVGCSGVRGELQVCGITDDGGMWHTIRHADGTWQPQFGDVKGQSGDPGIFLTAGCAGVSGELQVCGTTDDGGMWHTIRHADGTWQPQFGDVKGQSGNPGHFAALACGL